MLACFLFLANCTTTHLLKSKHPPIKSPPSTQHFVTTWRTDTSKPNCSEVMIPVGKGEFNYHVDWEGDGVFDDFDVKSSITHHYEKPGTYEVHIRGQFPHMDFKAHPDPTQLLEVKHWGDITWRSMERMFWGAKNMRVTATDRPNLHRVRSLNDMFKNASSFNDPIGHWDTSHITSMSGTFSGSTSFNQNINTWDTSKVQDMKFLFSLASSFNQPLKRWNTSQVTDFSMTFYAASTFNQNINTWDTSKAIHMTGMFGHATSFNQPLDSWDTSNVLSMNEMFMQASSFQQNISPWNTSQVTEMSFMFANAHSFNQRLDSWDTSKVTEMSFMFANAHSFDQPLHTWNLANLTSPLTLSSSGISTITYDKMLASWASQPDLPLGLTIQATGLHFCASSKHRQTLIDIHGWMFMNDSQKC